MSELVRNGWPPSPRLPQRAKVGWSWRQAICRHMTRERGSRLSPLMFDRPPPLQTPTRSRSDRSPVEHDAGRGGTARHPRGGKPAHQEDPRRPSRRHAVPAPDPPDRPDRRGSRIPGGPCPPAGRADEGGRTSPRARKHGAPDDQHERLVREQAATTSSIGRSTGTTPRWAPCATGWPTRSGGSSRTSVEREPVSSPNRYRVEPRRQTRA